MEAYIEETRGISGVVCYEYTASGVVCYEYTAIWAPAKNLVSWQFLEMYGIASYGSGGRNVVNQCLGLSYNTRFYCNTKLLFSDGLGQK